MGDLQELIYNKLRADTGFSLKDLPGGTESQENLCCGSDDADDDFLHQIGSYLWVE